MPPRLARLGLIALLAAEVVFLTVSFDSQGFDGARSPWLRVLRWSPHFLQFSITAAVVYAVLRTRRVRSPSSASHMPLSWRTRCAWLSVHLVSLVCFSQVSARVFGGTLEGWLPALFVSAWLLFGSATLAAWALVFITRLPTVQSVRANSTLVSRAVGLGALAWLAGFLTYELWLGAASHTMAIASAMLGLVYDDVISLPDRFVLGTEHFAVMIAPSCSGFESVGLLAVFLGTYLWAHRHELRFPDALMLVLIGAASLWLLIATRLAILVAIGTSWSQAVAAGGFHSQAGWLVFNAVSLGFVSFVNRRRLFMKTDATGSQPA